MKKILATSLLAAIMLTACGQTTSSNDSQIERPNSGSIHGLSESVGPSFLSE